jgi:hypothetical protein
MDWYNTAYWAHSAGAYDSWRTIYPAALLRAVLKPLTWAPCYDSDRGARLAVLRHLRRRDAAPAIFLLNLVLIFFAFRKLDRATCGRARSRSAWACR